MSLSVHEGKSEGIVLSSVRYGDNSRIVNVLTRDEGRLGFIFRQGSRHKSSGAMLLPLSGIDFVSSSARKGGLRSMRDVSLRHSTASVSADPVRRAEAFFIAELLCHTIPDAIPDDFLYDFVEDSVLTLETGIDGMPNFHLFFMMHLMDYIGIAPTLDRDGQPFFDMLSGEWTEKPTNSQNAISGAEADLWLQLASSSKDSLAALQLNRNSRQLLIDLMQRYYRLHHPGFSQLKSQSILSML